MASQEAIKELGTNGGGFYNANSAHPFENPNGFTNLSRSGLLLVIPFSLAFAFGRMAKDRSRAGSCSPRCSCCGSVGGLIAMDFEAGGNPNLTAARASTRRSPPTQAGGNMEGKEVRFGPADAGCSPPARPAPRPAR